MSTAKNNLEFSMMLGQQLAAARSAAGLTRSQAAALLEANTSTLYRWETGDRTPSLYQLYNIGAAYGVEPSALIPQIGSPSEGAAKDSSRARS